jgi:hypothetical protein
LGACGPGGAGALAGPLAGPGPGGGLAGPGAWRGLGGLAGPGGAGGRGPGGAWRGLAGPGGAWRGLAGPGGLGGGGGRAVQSGGMLASRVYAVGRLAYSAGLVFAPARLAAGWIGRQEATTTAAQIGLRGLAARDAALSLGIIVAELRGRSPRPWLALCALGDLADVAATIVAPPGDLPPNSRLGTIALAGSSALVGVALAARS